MPYSGGSSTHSGIAYQNWFLALQVAYSFFEANRIIYPEAFTTDISIIDDIKVIHNGQTTFFNVKYRSPASNLHWNQGDLKSQLLFKNLRHQHEANKKANIILVSESNCYLITEVFIRARNAMTPADLPLALESIKAIEEWEKAKLGLDYNDFQLLTFAKKVSMRSLPLFEIQNLIEHRFNPLGNSKAVSKLFFAKSIECSSNKTMIEKKNINKWLLDDGIHFNLDNK
ncbi:hypothetical protein [Polaribacter porphyrae]|uniref:Uncharacterized protein n=1 Tax=Polaribacter porphyrae TaxID=1137780 RepID=A0A2S7WMY4_9FLAO|nr:hypothetical protein [Polaribacter porphyrae]PQJ78968.1 hypothetical protein BTO18_07140 [Polaribacter porphyrae]